MVVMGHPGARGKVGWGMYARWVRGRREGKWLVVMGIPVLAAHACTPAGQPMMGCSSGMRITRERSRSARAAATVIEPVRPANMRAMRTYFAPTGRIGVMPVDRPTVANAEIVSNRMMSSV